MFQTPILFLIYNRPAITKKVFEVIRQVSPQKIFIAADGPKDSSESEVKKCQQTRQIADLIDWGGEVNCLFREKNLGCKQAVSSAIDWFFEHVDRGIILEDDCLPDQSFFSYCRELLEYYNDDDRIFQISGTNLYSANQDFPYSYFFSKYVEIWGWATWKRAWKFFDFEMKNLNEVIAKDGTMEAVLSNTDEKKARDVRYRKILRGQLSSWANIWAYTNFIQGGHSIIPKSNLVSNIGFGSEATHCKSQESQLGQKKIQQMSFPLKHPNYLVQSKKYDDQVGQTAAFSKNKYITGIKTLLSNSLNKIVKKA